MEPIHRRIILAAWPVVCGLVLGALVGGLTQSWPFGLLIGGLAWGCFAMLMRGRFVSEGPQEAARVVNPCELPDPNDLEQQLQLRNYGAIGMGTYAELYRRPDRD